jgi:hypothetical protein
MENRANSNTTPFAFQKVKFQSKKSSKPSVSPCLTIFHQQKSLDFWKNFAAACGSVVRQNVAKSTSSVSLDFRQVVGVGHGKT